MKSVKKLLLVFAALFCHLTASAYEFVVNGIYYTITSVDENTAGVSFHPSKKYKGDVVIPAQVTYDGKTYTVTSITARAFYYCHDLTNITLPNTIVSIGDEAFCQCNNLEGLTLPTSVKTLGVKCFAWCNKLSSLVIPNSITDIPNEAFQGCVDIKTLTLPSSVLTIGDNSFSGITALETLKLPNSIKTIGSAAFEGCNKLTSLMIPNSVTSIGARAFGGCGGITNITLSKNLTAIENSTFYACSQLTSIIIPNSVKKINYAAFDACYCLREVILGQSVETIGGGAFRDCRVLTSITLPSSLKEIDPENEYYLAFQLSPISTLICEAVEPPTLTRGMGISPTVYVPAGSVDLYKEHEYWGEYNIQPITVNEKNNILYTQETEGVKGTQMTLSLRMKHNRTVSGFQTNIVLPAGFTVEKVERGADLTSQYAFSNSAKADGSHFVLCYSSTNTPMPAGDIEVAKLTVRVPENAAEGDHNVGVKDVELSYGSESVSADMVMCKFIVHDNLPGDANGDGNVSVADISSIAAYLVDNITEGFILKAADANGDGRISVVDITTIAEQLFDDASEARTLYIETINE